MTNASSGGAEKRSRPMAGAIAAGVAVVLYPIVAWWMVGRFGAIGVAALTATVFTPQLVFSVRSRGWQFHEPVAWVPVAALACALLAALSSQVGWALLAPVGINLALGMGFGFSLLKATPMIERFARLQHPDLRPDEVRWCRVWTVVWTSFFFLNALLTGLLAWFAPIAWWATHTGLVAYLIIGGLVGGEIFARKLHFGFRREERVDAWLLERWPGLPERRAS